MAPPQVPLSRGPSADNHQPLGVVFTSYGGVFYGSNECRTTLAALKQFLEMNNVSVIGQFVCCGKKFGPGVLAEHEKPRMIGPGEMLDSAEYETADRKKITGSYFYHARRWDHPLDRDIQKAKFLFSDIVEDMFLTYDGKRSQVCSEYISNLLIINIHDPRLSRIIHLLRGRLLEVRSDISFHFISFLWAGYNLYPAHKTFSWCFNISFTE